MAISWGITTAGRSRISSRVRAAFHFFSAGRPNCRVMNGEMSWSLLPTCLASRRGPPAWATCGKASIFLAFYAANLPPGLFDWDDRGTGVGIFQSHGRRRSVEICFPSQWRSRTALQSGDQDPDELRNRVLKHRTSREALCLAVPAAESSARGTLWKKRSCALSLPGASPERGFISSTNREG